MPARAAAALPRELRGRPHAAPADARSEERIMPCGDSEFLMWRRANGTRVGLQLSPSGTPR